MFRHAVDSDYTPGPQHKGAGYGELTHRSAAPNGKRVAFNDLPIFGSHVAGWEDVRQEQHLLIR